MRTVHFFLLLMLGSCAALFAAEPGAASLVVPPLPACYAASAAFHVSVDGRDVPAVEHRVRGRLNCVYARFACSSAVRVTLRTRVPPGVWSVSPQSYGLAARADGFSITFNLPEPKYVVVTVDGVRVLILADPVEPVPPDSGPGVFNVRRAPYGADASGVAFATDAIQRAMDDAAAAGGPATVFIPSGVYKIKTLHARSNVSVCLDGSAVLQSGVRREDYEEYKPDGGKTGLAVMLDLAGVENVRVFGGGTLDARGFDLAGDAATIEDVRLKIRPLTVTRCTNVVIEGIIARESTSWTVPVFHSQNVTVRRVKVINDIGPLEHSDGINFCAVRGGLAEDCFVHTTDDAYCAKGHEGAPTEDVVFRRLVALSATRGLKCGMQAYEPMRRIRFEDVDIVQTRDGVDLMHWDGAGAWQDIVFKNIRVEKCERRSITAVIREGGSISGLRFENIAFAEARPGYLRGKDAGSRIEGVVISGLKIAGRDVADLKAAGITTNAFVGPVEFRKP